MSIVAQKNITPELEIVDRSISVRYIEHGWPERQCRWHAHEEYELHYIKTSTGTAYIGDYIGHFTQGSLFLTGPWLPHNWITEDNHNIDIPLRDKLIQFNHDSIVKWMSAYPEAMILSPMLEAAQLGIEFIDFPIQEAEERMNNLRDYNGLRKILCFYDFLLRLAQWPNFKILSLHSDNTNGWHDGQRINKVIRYVMENYAHPITLQDVATKANMSESAFSRYFHRTTSNTFNTFLIKVRIGHAATLLLKTSDKIATICHNVGFNNIANFNRHFLKIKGMTPREFRQQVKSALSPHQYDEQNLSIQPSRYFH